MNDNYSKSNKIERDFEWLRQSGRFSESFLESTRVPPELLIACVKHLTQSRNRRERKGLVISPEKLNQICQEHKHPRRSDLLEVVRTERMAFGKKLCKNDLAARKIIEWIGPVHWESLLISSTNLGMCPNQHCSMVIQKNGGCSHMRCFCGSYFQWEDAKLDVAAVSEGCRFVAKQWPVKTSELVFRKRVLQVVEQIVASAIQSPSSKKRRYKKQTEDYTDVIDSIRNRRASHSLRLEVIDEDCDFSTQAVSLNCECSPQALPLEIVAQETDESSSSTAYTHIPTDVSLSDYILVSDGENSCTASNEDAHWEESSFSILSGCESLQFPDVESYRGECPSALEDSSFSILSGYETEISLDDRKNCGMEEKTAGVLSYCNALKLGTSQAKNETKAVLLANPPANDRPKLSTRSTVQKERTFDKESTEDGDDDDDWLWFVYNATKSGHGGRRSSRFRGNSRNPKNCWATHRRPNWSRKRRKEHKFLVKDTRSW